MRLGLITDRRLAFRTSAHPCVQRSICGHFILPLYSYIGPDKRQLAHLHTAHHHHRLRFIPLKRIRPSINAFNTHNPCLTHRVR